MKTVGRLIQVKMTIHRWTGNKSRNDLRDGLAESVGGQADAFTTIVKLMPRDLRDHLNAACRALQNYWDRNTARWGEDGWRVIPTKRYHELTMGSKPLVDGVMKAASVLADCRLGILHQVRARMGSAFREEDVPTAEELRNAFFVTTRTLPIQDPTDFRFDGGLSEEDAKAIIEAERQRLDQSVQGAVGSLIEELQTLVTKVIEKMEGDVEKVKFGSLKTSVSKACDALINLTEISDKSEELRKKVESVRALTDKHTEAELKGNKSIRDEVRKDARELMDALASF